ncbi:MAG TPA: BON domain-containing protein [Vicinamibacterales bacterium]|nr:BON domain-containing protein [Vicinamibacterales bacterium]
MTDRDLQEHVQNALDWEPSVDAADIGVSVDDGIVTLRGDVKTYLEKAAAERVALGVYGVKAVANDVNVNLSDGQHRTDTEVAQAVVSALQWNTAVPEDKISVSVSNGWVTLKGQVDWEYHRAAAENTVRYLIGVRGVTNTIAVLPRVSATDVKSKIEAALKRSAEVDARRIDVAVADGTVTLSGNVHTWFERNEARQAAWAAPGVKEVKDTIAVVP